MRPQVMEQWTGMWQLVLWSNGQGYGTSSKVAIDRNMEQGYGT